MSQLKDQPSLLVCPFPSQRNPMVQRRDLPAWTRTTAVHTSVGKRRRVASPVNVDLDSSSPVTWRTANVSRVSHSFPFVKTHTHTHSHTYINMTLTFFRFGYKWSDKIIVSQSHANADKRKRSMINNYFYLILITSVCLVKTHTPDQSVVMVTDLDNHSLF